MKIKMILFALFMYMQSMSQHLNRFGHFINTGNEPAPYKLSSESGTSRVKTGNLTLDGSSVYKTHYGYVTLSGNDENAESYVRIYSADGNKLSENKFKQTLNFTLSANKKYAAFFDGDSLHVIDLFLQSYKILEGSDVFAVDNNGSTAWYKALTGTMHFNSFSALINDPVYRVLFYKGTPVFITMQNVFTLNNGQLSSIFTVTQGRVFDAETIGGKLYVSTKRETEQAFIFKSFFTDDLVQLFADEETSLSRNNKKRNATAIKNATGKLSNLTNELVADPLYYFNDTIYQPVGNSYCEMQEYTAGSTYPHPGVDLLGTYLQEVRSVKKGYVKAVLTTSAQYHWRIAISNLNTANPSQGYLYAHLDETTIPYMPGDSVNEADVVGLLVDFPVQGFVHCHFARITCQGLTWVGDWWTFDNPLTYMLNFYDSIPPEFEKTVNNDAFAFRQANGNYIMPDSLFGNVQVISKVFDRINEAWHCDVNSLRYSVSPLSSPQTMLLDSFAYEYNFYNDFYFSGPYCQGLLNTIYTRDSTCFTTGNYSVRDFYHLVTNSDGNDTISGNDSLQFFNTLSLADGSYIFRVVAFDAAGNSAQDSMIIQIKNNATGIHQLNADAAIQIIPNPSHSGVFTITAKNQYPLQYVVYNSTGEKIIASNGISSIIDLSRYSNGVYYVFFKDDVRTLAKKLVKL